MALRNWYNTMATRLTTRLTSVTQPGDVCVRAQDIVNCINMPC